MEMDCEHPRGRCDSCIQLATMRIKFGLKPFTPNVSLLLFGLTESRVNLPGANPPQAGQLA